MDDGADGFYIKDGTAESLVNLVENLNYNEIVHMRKRTIHKFNREYSENINYQKLIDIYRFIIRKV